MGLVRHWSRRRDLALSEEEKPESVDVIREIIRSAVVRVAGIFAAVYSVFVFTQEQEPQVEDGIVEVHFSTLVAVAAAEVRARGKNAYLYRPEVDGRWVLVPWDLVLKFGNLNGFAMPSNPSENWSNTFSEVERFLNRPCIKRMYYGVLAEMVDGPFSSEHLDLYLDLQVSIGAGNTHFGRPGNFID